MQAEINYKQKYDDKIQMLATGSQEWSGEGGSRELKGHIAWECDDDDEF